MLETGSLKPIAGVRVVLESAAMRTSHNLADKLIQLGMTFGATDGTGRFEIPHVTPGDYSCSFVKDGYAAHVIESLRIGEAGMWRARRESLVTRGSSGRLV